MKIAVLAGGLSPERDVSLTSGSLIAKALRERGHKVVLVDLFFGIDLDGTSAEDVFDSEQSDVFSVGEQIPDIEALRRENAGRALIGEGVLELCRCADIAFFALHGDIGENGQLQATFDNYKIKYTGSGYVGSLLAMDKDISKKMFATGGVNTPEWVYVQKGADAMRVIKEKIGFPCVIKPCSCGSSVGISMAANESELTEALRFAFAYEDGILAERRIIGREFTVGVLDGRALPAVEIIPKSGFYDYKNKYQSGLTTEICPAHISDALYGKMAKMALDAFELLRLDGYARFDFLVDGDDEIYCLEGNTLPGMTPTSLLPQMAAVVGMNYGELCEKIIELGLAKYEKL